MVEAVEIDLKIIVMSAYKVVRAVKRRMLMLFLYGVHFLALSIVFYAVLIESSKDIVYTDLCLLQCYSFSFLFTLNVLCAS